MPKGKNTDANNEDCNESTGSEKEKELTSRNRHKDPWNSVSRSLSFPADSGNTNKKDFMSPQILTTPYSSGAESAFIHHISATSLPEVVQSSYPVHSPASELANDRVNNSLVSEYTSATHLSAFTDLPPVLPLSGIPPASSPLSYSAENEKNDSDFPLNQPSVQRNSRSRHGMNAIFLPEKQLPSASVCDSESSATPQIIQTIPESKTTASQEQLSFSSSNLWNDCFSLTSATRNLPSELNLKASYARRVPPHLHSLVSAIHHLDDHDLTHIAYITEAIVKKEVYSLMPYSGANWFLPDLRHVNEEKGEKRWSVDYHSTEGLRITVAGMRLSLPVLNFCIRLSLVALLWLLLWFILGEEMEPGGHVFDPIFLLLVSAVVGGVLCRLLRIPPLVGVMWVAIMWHNVPHLGYLTSGVAVKVLEVASKAGLTVILAKAGYSISLAAMKPHWKQTLMLAIVPFAVEGVVGSVLANFIMPYNGRYIWAFLQGMLCAVASPAVVIPGANFLKKIGYDEEKDKRGGVGPLSLMISAIPLEIVLGIWCANFILSLLFEQQTVVVAAILAPVQIFGGGIAGCGVGWIFHRVTEFLKDEAARLPNGRFPPSHFRSRMRLAFILYIVLCLVMVIGGYTLKLAGGGCVMCVSFCATVSYIWCKPRKVHQVRDVRLTRTTRHGGTHSPRFRSRKYGRGFHPCYLSSSVGHPFGAYQSFRSSRFRHSTVVHRSSVRRLRAIETLSKEVIDEYKEQKLLIGAYLSDLWDQLMMPVLFSAMGARIDLLSVFNKSFFPRAISILLISTTIRFFCIMAVQYRSPMIWKRRLLVGIGYLGKASAQASIGPLAASMMSVNGAALWGPGGRKEDLALYEEYSVYAVYLRNVTALYVMLMAVVASIGVVHGGVFLLEIKKKDKKTIAKPDRCNDSSHPSQLPDRLV